MNTPKRNDPCPCGSGKKYKKCCLRREEAQQVNSRRTAAGHNPRASRHPVAAGRSPADQADWAFHLNLGNDYYRQKEFDRAIECFQRALDLSPNTARIHFNMGCALLNYGKADSAVAHFEKAIALKPDYVDAYLNLANTYLILHKPAATIASCQQALALKPDSAAAYLAQGLAWFALDDFDAGVASCRLALANKPDFDDLIMMKYNLGANYYKQGRLEEARGYYQQVLELKPKFLKAFGPILFTMLASPAYSAAELYQAHLDFAQRIESLVKTPLSTCSNDPRPDRRLKVGYVSPDFNRHSVALFMEPILAHHDKRQVEVYAYYNGIKHDEVTTRFMGYVDHWVPCRHWTDRRLAEHIRRDGIDVLVDLAGYTVGHRLRTFAHRPAPVQVTYLGYMATTGLSAMDYRLSSDALDPPGQEAWHSENLYRLPLGLWCFRPGANRGEIEPDSPVSKNGFITFGSTNNPIKISQETFMLWCEILHALPDARLLMTNLPGANFLQSLTERFAEQGIEARRLSFHTRESYDEFQDLLPRIDIALDPFPYNGTTTTCEALWMGIPVVSLVGETSVARSGYALLKAVGLEELVARDTKDYVRIAVELARDPARLASLRTGLRGRMEASALRDEVGFTRALETAYREIWTGWCETRTVRHA